ncbi:phage tail protein [Lactiplantibacillus plantarum]|uniref:phage tail protein n=1 Tax=Lactiplantibacillus plantarum TaxID=1590 RepID=UPI002B4BDC56|nr:phage tail protein [Lactiplantibacillus plantarum]WRM31856.1 phage tail protein [Lactiplantibacillus plantarum]
MAESNATQVILTDDGLKIINAQNTADSAASGVTDLNDPNLMSVIEKQTQAAQYAGLTSQYNVILARAKDASINTADLTIAYTNLNTFMTGILTDTTKASDVNRDTYKSLIDAYNTALSNVQTALSDSFNTDIDNMQSSVSVASQAASSAVIVASQATSTGNNASQVASQAASAANQASADYTALSAGVKDGSVVHITTKTVIDDAVIGTAEIADAAITDAKIGNISANHLTAGSIDASKVTVANLDAGNITTGTLSTDRLDVDKLSALSANLGDVTTGSLKGVNIVANSFSTPNGSFTTDVNGNVVASNLTIRGVTNLIYNAALLGGSGSSIPGWGLNGEPYYDNSVLFDGLPAIAWNGDATGRWDNYANSKFQPVTQTGIPYSASIKFRDYGSASGMLYTFTLGFFSAYDANTRVGYLQRVYTANGSDSGIQTFTINNAIAPSNAKYVAIQLYAYNGKGHVAFSSPMLTQTAQATGYQPDTGNVVSAGEIDGSVINGSTINGTTFHGGDSISDSNNTSNFYPFTIEPTGKASTTLFNSMGALRTEMSGGGLRTMYRAINSSGSQYEAYDGNFSGDMISLNSGFTNGKDMSFSQSVSGSQLTGQVLISPLNGLTLHGDTQQITFNGTSADVTPKGIIITPYGNINPNGTQNIWYVGNGPTMKTASFGIDGSGANNIQFNRSLDIGNFHINTYHTITSSDNGPIHFNRANGSSVDIFAATVNYTSLVKSSLLSVKKDVKKADTAYWAQLVNSIDLATYQYKTDDNTSHLRLSSIVDDVNDTKQWQLPDVFISRDEDGKLCGVDDSVLLNATLATVQEQQKEIDQLNGHLLELEAKLNG